MTSARNRLFGNTLVLVLYLCWRGCENLLTSVSSCCTKAVTIVLTITRDDRSCYGHAFIGHHKHQMNAYYQLNYHIACSAKLLLSFANLYRVTRNGCVVN